MKPFNLFERDVKIVEKKKIFFIIPVAIVVLAIIMGIIFRFTLGSAVNLGMDFTGGYTVEVKLSTKLTEANYSDYKAQIEDIFDNLADDEGNKYGLKVSSMQKQGSGDSASIYVRYQAVKEEKGVDTQRLMEDEVNVKLIEELNELFAITPSNVEYGTSEIKVTYLQVVSEPNLDDIRSGVLGYSEKNSLGISAEDISVSSDDAHVVIIRTAAQIAEDKRSEFKSVLNIPEYGRANQGEMISGTVSKELLTNAILAVSLAIVLMLVYIAFRFEVSSGVAAILALLHDIIIMFSFIVIFHIEIGSTFIAALITILGYSINNTIIIFDRIRENHKSVLNKNMTAADIANRSVKETLLRSINTTVTTLLMIGMVAIIGVPSIRIFALPIIIGLLAGTYSSIFISPSIWATWKGYLEKKHKKVSYIDKNVQVEKAQTENTESN